MKILFLLTRSADETLATIIQENQKIHHITIIDLSTDKDYEQLIALIESCDRVISW
jgi:hypothetical protein